MPKGTITLVPGPTAAGYPITTKPAVYRTPLDGEASLIVGAKPIGSGVTEGLLPFQLASETTLEAMRLLMAAEQPQPMANGHFVLNLSSAVASLQDVAGGIPNGATGVKLALEAGDDRIRFTEDGTNPTLTKGFLWKNSLNDEGYLIRAYQTTLILAQLKFLLVGDVSANGAIIQGVFTRAAL